MQDGNKDSSFWDKDAQISKIKSQSFSAAVYISATFPFFVGEKFFKQINMIMEFWWGTLYGIIY